MGFILFIMVAGALAVSLIALIWLIFLASKKEINKNIIGYGFLLSIVSHLVIFLSFAAMGRYWVFTPILSHIKYLVFMPFLLSILMMSFKDERLAASNKITFLKIKNIRNIYKIILVSIIFSVIISCIVLQFYKDLLGYLGAKVHY